MGLRAVMVGCVVVALVSAVTAVASAGNRPQAGSVRLVVNHRVLRAGQEVPVTVLNGTTHWIVEPFCFVLQRRDPDGWVTITRSHGIDVVCPPAVGRWTAAHSHGEMSLYLWDDLVPGAYRATLVYKRGTRRTSRLAGNDHYARLSLTVRAFRPVKHHMSEKRILRIALRAAKNAGDPHPTLIQHSEGTRFMANLIGTQGDVVYAWNWSYLIAERGHFVNTGVGPANQTIHASTIVVIVDAATGQITDSGSSNSYPHLARLGPVTTDLQTRGHMAPAATVTVAVDP